MGCWICPSSLPVGHSSNSTFLSRPPWLILRDVSFASGLCSHVIISLAEWLLMCPCSPMLYLVRRVKESILSHSSVAECNMQCKESPEAYSKIFMRPASIPLPGHWLHPMILILLKPHIQSVAKFCHHLLRVSCIHCLSTEKTSSFLSRTISMAS